MVYTALLWHKPEGKGDSRFGRAWSANHRCLLYVQELGSLLAASVSASIGTRAHYQASDDSATAFIRYKNGLAGVAVAVGFADGAPSHECHVICANGSLRFSQHSEKFVKVGKGDKWEDVPFDDPPFEFQNEWKAFAEAIEQNIEPPTHGEWGRHIMEIMFAAEESAITGVEVELEEVGWSNQESGSPVTRNHGWI